MYGRSAPFPLSRLLPWAHMRATLQQAGGVDQAEVLQQAQIGLRALSVRLGSAPFFGFDRPTQLDATAYGFLAVALYAPLPKPKVAQLIREHRFVRVSAPAVCLHVSVSAPL